MTKKIITFLTALITIIPLLPGCGKSNEANENGNIKLRRHEDIRNKRVGVLLGSVHDKFMMNTYPQAAIMQYKSPSEIILAVKSGKVDAAMYTTETLTGILKADPELRALGDTVFTIPIAMGFNQNNDALREKFNVFLKKIKSNGVFDDMAGRWIKRGVTETPDIKNPAPNGELVVGVVSDKGLPFTIVKDNKMVGFDIELSERFAAFLGKKLKLADMEFGSLIIAAATNKIDMIASTLMITEERKKQIDFSDPYYRLGATIFSLTKNIEETDAAPLTKLEDIRHKRIGILAGTVYDAFVTENYPEASGLQYNNNADMILALKTGKIDVAFFDYFSGRVMMKSNPEIGILTDDALNLPQGYGFSKKNPELRKKFNNYLKAIKANGYFDQIYKRWFIDDPEKAVMPEFKFDANGPVLTLGISVGDLPYSAFINGNYIGFDNELLKSFASSAGYQLKIISMDFSGLIASLASGKTDIIADGICITPERSKQVDFSDKYLDFRTSVLALNTSLGKISSSEKNVVSAMPSFIDGIKESFNNNIMLEDRYLLIVDGLKTTAVISVFSILFGSILGALICFMRMSHRKVLQVPARIYISLLRGTPVLVVLMIIFYVIFASVDIDPAIVAVIAFGLNFAAYVSEMFRTGIEGVDRGQTEAGIAMGFSRVKTFIYIVMPQAAIRVLPVFKGEIISLVKMTSIVGYIAVQDLTKASDIIRSRTFDAFFPLIMVAVLYFLISWLLMLILGYVERRSDPRTKRVMEAGK